MTTREKIVNDVKNNVYDWVRLDTFSKCPDTTKPDMDLATFIIKMPKFLLAQFNKHASIRSSAASSRAIPSRRVRDNIAEDIFLPPLYTLNEKGMAGNTFLGADDEHDADADLVAFYGNVLEPFIDSFGKKYNVHKQHLNRFLEPFMWTTVVATANRKWWQHLINLRDSEHAQPEFQIIARQLATILDTAVPQSPPSNWHVPLLTGEERYLMSSSPGAKTIEVFIKRSAARAARISYGKLDVEPVEIEFARANRLIEDRHMVPFEHSAKFSYESDTISGPYGYNWQSYRHLMWGYE